MRNTIGRSSLIPLIFSAQLLCLGQANLDSVVERTREAFEVPGIAVAVVKDGELVLAKGYGVRKFEEPAPVTARTLFGVASNSKAFTAAALAILVDEGKLQWDDPVVQHLPWFQMADPYVTREMTVRDLLVHRSGLGLGAGDLMYFPPTDLSRDEIVRRLRFVRSASSFRSRYAYDNILFIVAGQLIATVSGKSWDDFLKERIFKPLCMNDTNTSVKDLKPGDDYAWPHAKADGKLEALAPNDSDNWGAAAGINSSVTDMARWMVLQLNQGKNGDKRLFSEAQAREMWQAQTVIPVRDGPKELAEARMNFSAYGLGWSLTDYRGRKVVSHTGGLAGMVTRITLIPDLKLGVAVFTNQEAGGAFNAITNTVLDHYMGASGADWVAAYVATTKKRAADAGETVKKAAEKRNTQSRPSLALSGYAGRYRDVWYGDIIIAEEGGKLVVRFTHTPDLVGELEHWQYDTFIARWHKRSLLADAYMTFALKPDGSVAELKMAAVSPLTDFSFDFHDLLFKPVKADAKPY